MTAIATNGMDNGMLIMGLIIAGGMIAFAVYGIVYGALQILHQGTPYGLAYIAGGVLLIAIFAYSFIKNVGKKKKE